MRLSFVVDAATPCDSKVLALGFNMMIYCIGNKRGLLPHYRRSNRSEQVDDRTNVGIILLAYVTSCV